MPISSCLWTTPVTELLGSDALRWKPENTLGVQDGTEGFLFVYLFVCFQSKIQSRWPFNSSVWFRVENGLLLSRCFKRHTLHWLSYQTYPVLLQQHLILIYLFFLFFGGKIQSDLPKRTKKPGWILGSCMTSALWEVDVEAEVWLRVVKPKSRQRTTSEDWEVNFRWMSGRVRCWNLECNCLFLFFKKRESDLFKLLSVVSFLIYG